MKVNFNPNLKLNAPSFTGFEVKKNNLGTEVYEFNFPHDADKFDCYLEIGNVDINDDDQFYVKDVAANDDDENRVKIGKNGTRVNLQEYGIGKNEPFAYKFILTNKDTKEEYSQVDSGLRVGGKSGEYNLITQMGSKIQKGGAAMLLIPDSYNVGWVYNKDGKPEFDTKIQKKAVNSARLFSTKMGGTLAGMEEKIPYWKQMGISRLFSTPLFTDDNVSYHSYWIKNAMQMSQNIGSVDNYASFQKKLFKAGINLVADGAFVNEGLEGVHFKHVLKWGEKSPYYYWFRANGIEAGPLTLGVLSSGKNYISHKVVNSPYKYEQKEDGSIKISSQKYDPKKPTYVQIFDNRLASEKQKNDTKNLIEAYDNLNTDDILDINNHDDTVIPYKFEINPETYNENVKKLKQHNKKTHDKVTMDSLIGTRMLAKFENFSLEEKNESGFETWVANTDIPKINYGLSQSDLKALKNKTPKQAKEIEEFLIEKNFEAQDYAISSGKYWTKKTKDILLEEAANTLKNLGDNPTQIMQKINQLADDGQLPKNVKEKVSEKMVKAALDNSYDLPRTKRIASMKDLLLSGLMDLPLDAIELGDDLVATMATPYMTNRAYQDEEVGVSRYLLQRNGNPHLLEKYENEYMATNAIYTEKMLPKAEKIMKMVNNAVDHQLFDTYNATTLGKYVLPIVGQDIAKFMIIKALSPDAIIVKQEADGTQSYSYDYKKTKATTFETLGLRPETPQNEVHLLLDKMESKISKLSAQDLKPLIDTVIKRVKGTDEAGYKVAEMILDATGTGLDWRIDATKDVADMDGVNNKNVDFADAWNDVINFWGKFTDSVVRENRNSYLVAEVTDIQDNNDIKQLIQSTGMTSVANYSYFFTTLAETFGKNFEQGYSIGNRNSKINDELKKFLESDQLQSLIYSYTFAGNHDKPRLLHCLAVDMGVFFADFNYDGTDAGKIKQSADAKKTAEYVLNKAHYEIDFDKLSPKAVAVADVLKHALEASCDELSISKTEISKTIEKLVQAEKTRADGFATKPFEKSMEYIVEKALPNLDKDQKKKLLNKSFEKALAPAMSRFEALSQFLVSIPGISTLFAGDDLGMTGYEGKCKNDYHQNRNALNWDWLNDVNKKFVQEFNKRVNSVMQLRSKPELEPLNTGTPYLLEQQIPKGSSGTPITGLLRQGSNGAMTVSLLNAAGVTPDKSQGIFDTDLKLDGIKINGMGLGLSAGIKEGTIFKNADASDNSTYRVVKVSRDNGRYFDYLIKKDGGDIQMSKPTLILYHQPEVAVPKQTKGETSFTGKKILYNPQYNFTSNPYVQIAKQEMGSKLALLSR